MGSALATPEIVAAYVKIAHEFHLPILAPRIPGDPLKLSAQLSEKDVMVDSVTIAGPNVSADKWKDFLSRRNQEYEIGSERNHRPPWP